MASFDPYHKWLAIPPEEQPPNHYRLLALPLFEWDADVIDAAAEQRTVFLRSFQTGPNAELAERLLNEVSEARVCLLDGKSKARYDTQLKASQQPAQPVAEETVPEVAPVPLVTPPRSVASKVPSTRTQSRRRPADKPLWQQPWVMATAGAVAVVLLLIFINSGGDNQKPADNPKGTTTAKVDSKPKVKVPNKKTEEEQQAELKRLAEEQAKQDRLQSEKTKPDQPSALNAEDERVALAKSHMEKGYKYYTEKKYDLAIAEYTKAIQVNPLDADAYTSRGAIFHLKGDYQTAIADHTDAIRIKPDDAKAYHQRGFAYREKKEYDRAIADFTDAIRIKPDHVEAYYWRGVTHRESGQHDKAIADFTDAIRIKPDDAKAYHQRGYVYKQKGEDNKAIADFTDAIRKDPSDASAYYNRGSCHYRKTEWDKAIADFTESISRGNLPKNTLPEIYHWRAMAYEKVGDQTKAFYDKREAKKLGYKPEQ